MKYELLGEESPGIFDTEDILRMAADGLIVRTVAYGQAVYREIPEETTERLGYNDGNE